MGSAFTAIVNSLVTDIITPVVGMICAGVNIADLSVTIASAKLQYGLFLQAILNFLIIALVVFCMVKAINTARAKADALKKKKKRKNRPKKKSRILSWFFSKRSATCWPRKTPPNRVSNFDPFTIPNFIQAVWNADSDGF
ncbi:large conductance mechanosensitive channel protein MscL [Allobaculum sp. Allo2]|uniref:large conductance mechanosensitive channel protein MscL n=1 Tax=Allobaculum sp. Allo2 TaxID=2853432 RepID=UPI001F60D1E0|nr:large conductance mechanosensitive channel protein MscL [Allobaculum sp. Allo2]